MTSSVVSIRVPSWVKRVLDEKRIEYQGVVREVLTGLAEAASGEAVEKLREAFRLAEEAWGEARLTTEEVIEAIRCRED